MLAIRPPEYWPRCAYMALVDRADRFVLADTFQYSRQSFQNRARLRTPQGWQWITVPLRGGQHGRPILETAIEGDPYWARKHWRAMTHNYGAAPFFPFYEAALREVLYRSWTSLGDLTCATVELLTSLLGLDTPLVRCSDLEGVPSSLPEALRVGESGVLLAPRATATHDARQVPVAQRFDFRETVRRQNFAGFVADLSALDLLLNYGAESASILRAGASVEAG